LTYKQQLAPAGDEATHGSYDHALAITKKRLGVVIRMVFLESTKDSTSQILNKVTVTRVPLWPGIGDESDQFRHWVL
jgi:hypothetical protein